MVSERYCFYHLLFRTKLGLKLTVKFNGNFVLQLFYLCENIWMKTFSPGELLYSAKYKLQLCFLLLIFNVYVFYIRNPQLSVLANLESLLGQTFPSPSTTKKEVVGHVLWSHCWKKVKMLFYIYNNYNCISFFEGFQHGVWHMLCISP